MSESNGRVYHEDAFFLAHNCEPGDLVVLRTRRTLSRWDAAHCVRLDGKRVLAMIAGKHNELKNWYWGRIVTIDEAISTANSLEFLDEVDRVEYYQG